jgi:hypothetical protein
VRANALPASSTQSAMRMQAPQRAATLARRIYSCPAPPPAVAGASWGANCAGLTAGKVCTAVCRGSATAGFTAVCKANGAWTDPKGAGCGPASKGALQESAASRQQAFMQLPAAGKCSGSPPAVRGAVWATCSGVESGQSCTAACNEAGTVGEFNSLCMPDGSW